MQYVPDAAFAEHIVFADPALFGTGTTNTKQDFRLEREDFAS